ncbi:MAG: peptidoglycan-binding protein LysM [Pseudomonadota bacterium]
MGLFDFAADIGKKVFGIGDANAADQIKENIEANNPGVSDLSVTLDDEVCTISGTCDSIEAKEKVVLMAGNMKGVGSVNGDGLTAPDPEPEAPEPEYYVIESGDTLWGIAAKFLGNGSKYPEIFEANREVIEDPDKIFPGQKIRIPR